MTSIEDKIVERGIESAGARISHVAGECSLHCVGVKLCPIRVLKTWAQSDVERLGIENLDARSQIGNVTAGGRLTKESGIDRPVVGVAASGAGNLAGVELDGIYGTRDVHPYSEDAAGGRCRDGILSETLSTRQQNDHEQRKEYPTGYGPLNGLHSAPLSFDCEMSRGRGQTKRADGVTVERCEWPASSDIGSPHSWTESAICTGIQIRLNEVTCRCGTQACSQRDIIAVVCFALGGPPRFSVLGEFGVGSAGCDAEAIVVEGEVMPKEGGVETEIGRVWSMPWSPALRGLLPPLAHLLAGFVLQILIKGGVESLYCADRIALEFLECHVEETVLAAAVPKLDEAAQGFRP